MNIKTSHPCLLLAGADIFTVGLLRAAVPDGIGIITITPDLYHTPLGLIAASHGHLPGNSSLQAHSRPEKGEGPGESILVLCGWKNDPGLDRILSLINGSGASVSLKAVLTPANASWTILQLYEELKREREKIILREK